MAVGAVAAPAAGADPSLYPLASALYVPLATRRSPPNRHSCFLFKLRSMLEAVEAVVSPSFRDEYHLGTVSTVLILVGATGISVVGAAIVLVRDLMLRSSLPVAVVAGGTPLEPPTMNGMKYHIFISYTWSSGQDQVRQVKQLLKEVLPGIRIFLDVDDLEDISVLNEEVEAAQLVLAFVSTGYFQSRPCQDELRYAIEYGKPIVLLRESASAASSPRVTNPSQPSQPSRAPPAAPSLLESRRTQPPAPAHADARASHLACRHLITSSSQSSNHVSKHRGVPAPRASHAICSSLHD